MGYIHKNSKGVTYYLNSKEVELRGGKYLAYYFSKDKKPEHCDLPSDRMVVENKNNGVPFAKVKK